MNRELLEKPFDPSQIKQRQGVFGDLLDYVEGPAIIQRLNDAFEGEWSFEVMEHKVNEQEVTVLGKLSHAGITKMQFGKSKITRSKKDNSLVSLGDDLKAAATDALKKCATLFGVGLHLYLDENDKPAEPAAPAKPLNDAKPAAVPPNDYGRITARQLSAIFAIARARGMSNKDVRSYTQEVFGKVPDFLTRREASTIIQQLQEEDRSE